MLQKIVTSLSLLDFPFPPPNKHTVVDCCCCLDTFTFAFLGSFIVEDNVVSFEILLVAVSDGKEALKLQAFMVAQFISSPAVVSTSYRKKEERLSPKSGVGRGTDRKRKRGLSRKIKCQWVALGPKKYKLNLIFYTY